MSAEIFIGPDDDESLLRSNNFIWPKGLSPEGKLVRPERALPGVTYTCMKCRVKLGRGRSPKPHDNPYFRHPRLEGGCTGESIVHLAAKHNLCELVRWVLKGRLRLGVQARCMLCQAFSKTFPLVGGAVIEEYRDPATGRTYDVAAVSAGTVVTAAFEVVVTHAVDDQKQADLVAAGVPWFEIDANTLLVRRIEELLDSLEDGVAGDEIPTLVLPARRVPHTCIESRPTTEVAQAQAADATGPEEDVAAVADQEEENRRSQTRRSRFAAELAQVFATSPTVVLRTSMPCPACGARGLETMVQRRHYHRVSLKHRDDVNGTVWDLALLRAGGGLALGVMIVVNEGMHSPLHIGVTDEEQVMRWIAVPIYVSYDAVTGTGLVYEPGDRSRIPLIRCNNQSLSPKAAMHCGECAERDRVAAVAQTKEQYRQQLEAMNAEMAGATTLDQVTQIGRRCLPGLSDLVAIMDTHQAVQIPDPENDVDTAVDEQHQRLWDEIEEHATQALASATVVANAALSEISESSAFETAVPGIRTPFIAVLEAWAHGLQRLPSQLWDELVLPHRKRIEVALARAAADRQRREEERIHQQQEDLRRRREEAARREREAYEALPATKIKRVREQQEQRVRAAGSMAAIVAIAMEFRRGAAEIIASATSDGQAVTALRAERALLLASLRRQRVVLIEQETEALVRQWDGALSLVTSLDDLERLAQTDSHCAAWRSLRRRIDGQAVVQTAARAWESAVAAHRSRLQRLKLRQAWAAFVDAVQRFSLGPDAAFSMQEEVAGNHLLTCCETIEEQPAWLRPIIAAIRRPRRRREDEAGIRALVVAARHLEP